MSTAENTKPNRRTAKPKDERELLVQRLSAYVSLFQNTPEGRLVLDDLKKSLDGPSYRPGMRAEDMIWLEGRRSVYLDIAASVGQGVELIESAGEVTQDAETEEPVLNGGVLTAPLD